jgi:hypothetical protein
VTGGHSGVSRERVLRDTKFRVSLADILLSNERFEERSNHNHNMLPSHSALDHFLERQGEYFGWAVQYNASITASFGHRRASDSNVLQEHISR